MKKKNHSGYTILSVRQFLTADFMEVLRKK